MNLVIIIGKFVCYYYLHVDSLLLCFMYPHSATPTDLKVVCLAFSDTFSLQHWHKISQWVISLTYRKGLILPDPLKNVALGSKEGEGIRQSRLSSVSTASSQTGPGMIVVLHCIHTVVLHVLHVNNLCYRKCLCSVICIYCKFFSACTNCITI